MRTDTTDLFWLYCARFAQPLRVAAKHRDQLANILGSGIALIQHGVFLEACRTSSDGEAVMEADVSDALDAEEQHFREREQLVAESDLKRAHEVFVRNRPRRSRFDLMLGPGDIMGVPLLLSPRNQYSQLKMVTPTAELLYIPTAMMPRLMAMVPSNPQMAWLIATLAHERMRRLFGPLVLSAHCIQTHHYAWAIATYAVALGAMPGAPVTLRRPVFAACSALLDVDAGWQVAVKRHHVNALLAADLVRTLHPTSNQWITVVVTEQAWQFILGRAVLTRRASTIDSDVSLTGLSTLVSQHHLPTPDSWLAPLAGILDQGQSAPPRKALEPPAALSALHRFACC